MLDMSLIEKYVFTKHICIRVMDNSAVAKVYILSFVSLF